jgi:hypothetical protein
MAGQIPLDTKYYPSDFTTENINVVGTGTGSYDVMIADRPMVVDAIKLYIPAEMTANADRTGKFRIYNPVGGVTTPSVATGDIGGMKVRDLTNLVDILGTTAPGTGTATDYPRLIEFTINTANNVLDTGEVLRWTGSATLTGVSQMVIQVRWRSQL